MSRGAIYQYGNAGFTVTPQGQYNPAPVSGQGNTQVSYSPSTTQNYSTSGYGVNNPIGGTPTQTAGGMLTAGSNYTGNSGGSSGDLGGQATSLYSTDVPTSARSPEQINNQAAPTRFASLESEFATDPFEYDETLGQDYDTALQDWELQRDYNEGAIIAKKATMTLGGTAESNAGMLLNRARWTDTPEQQYELAKDLSAYLGGQQASTLSSQLLAAGYTAEELQSLGIGQRANPDDYLDETGVFDYNSWLADWKETGGSEDKNYFELFDNKVLETKANQAETWDELSSTSPQDFSTAYDNASVSDKNSYLYNQFKDGDLDANSYKLGVIQNLAQSGKKVVQVDDKYYYYEPKGGSSDTSFKIDGSEQYFEVNFTPESFDANATARVAGTNSSLRTDNIDDKVIVGTDALGQLLYKETSARNVELTEEEKKKHQEANFLSYGIGSRGKQVNPFKNKMRDEFLAVARIGAAIITGGTSEAAISAGKGIAGETLHSQDYLNIATSALEFADVLAPPTDGDPGKGILGLDYNESKGLLTGAITGDPVSAIAESYGPALVEKALDKVGGGDALNTFATDNNINADDLKEGVTQTVKALSQGDSIEDAVLKGVGKYVAEGGTILPDVVEDALGDAAKKLGDIVEPVSSVLSTINDTFVKPITSEVGGLLSGADTAVRQGLSALDDNVIQPLTESAGDALSAADTAVRQGLATFDEEVLQPVTQPLGDVIEDVAQATGDVVEDVGQGLGDVVENVAQAAGDVAEDVAQATGDVAEDVAQATGDVVEDIAQVTGDVVEEGAQVVGDVLSDAETAVRQALEDIELPDLDLGLELPDLDLDIEVPDLDIELPDLDIELPDLDIALPQVAASSSSTRTTGGLFDISQFEHDKGISLIGNLLTGLTEQDAQKLSKKQYQQPPEEVVDLLSDPFANAFNYKV
jgi:hypothetical protein